VEPYWDPSLFTFKQWRGGLKTAHSAPPLNTAIPRCGHSTRRRTKELVQPGAKPFCLGVYCLHSANPRPRAYTAYLKCLLRCRARCATQLRVRSLAPPCLSAAPSAVAAAGGKARCPSRPVLKIVCAGCCGTESLDAPLIARPARTRWPPRFVLLRAAQGTRSSTQRRSGVAVYSKMVCA
jgi:hypothetical protein